ncbi:MAG: hypothetical protein ABJD11_09725 [Gemmatimonadota bacterium]
MPLDLPEGDNEIVLTFPWSSRVLPAFLCLAGLLIVASAFLGEFGTFERILRGLSGVVATACFVTLLVWNFSFTIRADQAGLVSRSIFGSRRIAWNDIESIHGKAVTRDVTTRVGGFRPYRTSKQTIARYTVVTDRTGSEIRIRDDLVPVERRNVLIEILHQALASRVEQRTPSS